jgi:hypothetical protein
MIYFPNYPTDNRVVKKKITLIACCIGMAGREIIFISGVKLLFNNGKRAERFLDGAMRLSLSVPSP